MAKTRTARKNETMAKPEITTCIGTSEFGYPMPRLTIEWVNDPVPSYDIAMATMLETAAAIYRARPAPSDWIVNVPSHLESIGRFFKARIDVETVGGTQAEAEAALQVLQAVAEGGA